MQLAVFADAVIEPQHVCLRPKLLGTRPRQAVAGIGLAGLVAVLATARADRPVERRAEPQDAQDALQAVRDAERAARLAEERALEATWTLAAEPATQIGYRQGRRRSIEVVPLGPDAIDVEVNTARAFLEMRAAAAEDGVTLGLGSGFRTRAEQAELYRAWRQGKGNKAARPGRSNHQSGRALDIPVNTVPGALEWLEANAASFGFKRTVRSEPWHWEYVEIPRARGKARNMARHQGNTGAHGKARGGPAQAQRGPGQASRADGKSHRPVRKAAAPRTRTAGR
jgi:hypothetical protein